MLEQSLSEIYPEIYREAFESDLVLANGAQRLQEF